MSSLPTAAATAQAVRAGHASAETAVRESLDLIARRNDDIDAFAVVRGERALAEAAAVDARPDRASLPLAGVPVAIKDNVPVAGEPMRVGSAATSDEPQSADHIVVERIRAAGGVVVGITRVPELCVFGATDSVYGVTRNPWDLTRTPGGSSGGSAAAVASGMVPIAHGNDGMGSVRIPAACTGLVGIKPGLGTVPAHLGENDWFSMSENGALATTPEDAALLLSVMADDPRLAEVAPVSKRLRVGVSMAPPVAGVTLDPAWAAAAERLAALLRQESHDVRRAEPTSP
ncbi:MAG: amidase, partial [Candidatus Nanopelagicales bacterium]